MRFDDKKLKKKLENMEDRSGVAILMYAEEGAKKFENYAKANRPWTDRTGHARQRLHGYVEQSLSKVRVGVAHGVDYGVYLEYAHEQRFAILWKTVQALSSKVLQGYEDLLKEITK